jgi:biopolymer transport protein ExbD
MAPLIRKIGHSAWLWLLAMIVGSMSEQVGRATHQSLDDAAMPVIKESESAPEIMVFVKSSKDGLVDAIVVRVPKQKEVRLPKEKWPETFLKHLKRVRPRLKNQDELQFGADNNLLHAEVIRLMDVCTEAGFERISFLPPPDSDR